MHDTATSQTPDDSRRHRLIFTQHLDRIPARLGLWRHDDTLSAAQERLHAALHQAIHTALTEKQREVVELFFFEGLSQGAIARRLGVSQQVVHRRIYGARRGGKQVGGAIRRLREALNPHVESLTA